MTGQTQVEQFSCVPLRNGDSRTVAVLTRPGDRPALAVTVFRGGRVVSRMLFHADRLAVLRAAIRRARDEHLEGRAVAGDVPLAHGLRVEVWTLTGSRPAVAFVRRSAAGERIGRAVALGNVELDALEQALSRLAPTGATSSGDLAAESTHNHVDEEIQE